MPELDTFLRGHLHFTEWAALASRARWRDATERLNEIEKACRALRMRKEPRPGFVHEYDVLLREFHCRQRDIDLKATQTLYLIGALTAFEFERHMNIPRSATALALNSKAGARWLKSVQHEDAMATGRELWHRLRKAAWRNATKHEGTGGEIGLLGDTLGMALPDAYLFPECRAN